MRKKLLLLFLAVQSVSMMFAETSANILTDASLEQPVAAGEDFEDYAVGQWKYLVCSENGTTATASQEADGHTGKCLSLTLGNVPAGDPWSCLLYQDVKSLRPTRYELLFWVKADKTANSAINVTAVDKNTNNILAKSSETGFRYSVNGWQPCLTYLDFTNSYSDLKNIRLSIHFSESGTYLIDDVSLRPVYDVPFNVNDSTSTLTDYLSFDEPSYNFFSWGTGCYSTPTFEAPLKKVGGAANYTVMRYTNCTERGAQPIEGNHSLLVEVSEVSGNPTYEIAATTKSIAAAADGKKIRLSFWAKSDTSSANNSATQQSFCIVPRFASASGFRVQLTGEWKKYSYDYDFASFANSTYRYFRFQFDRVNKYQLDAMTLEYVDMPEVSKIDNTSYGESSERIFKVLNNGIRITEKVNTAIRIYTADGRICADVNAANTDFVPLRRGVYIVSWRNSHGTNFNKILIINK